jgi:hypothetical protein
MWVRLDDGFYRHPKARQVGKEGRALFVAGLCWAAGHLTDGFIARSDLGLIAAEAEVRPRVTARLLVDAGLWEEAHNGWVIHDYQDFNPSAEEVRERRRKRAEAGRLGGLKSRPPGSKRLSKSEATLEASALASAQANGKQNRTPYPYPTKEPTSSVSLQGAVDNSEGGDLIDQAITMAARRYGEQQVASGKGDSAPGLAKWWLQENAEGARIHAAELLTEYDLRPTTLADALLQANPGWLRNYRKRAVT